MEDQPPDMSQQTPTPPKNTAGYMLAAIAIIIAVAALDQWTKWYVLERLLPVAAGQGGFIDWFTTAVPAQDFMARYDDFRVVTFFDMLDFRMVWNRGVSFGLLQSDSPGGRLLLTCFSLLVASFLFTWLAVARGRVLLVALPLIIGGAIGNVCDRLRFGAVADFVDAHIGAHHWPAFNLADSCICAGAFILILQALLERSPEKQAEVKHG